MHQPNMQHMSKDLRIHDKNLISCNWSGDGKYLGTCFQDKQLKICQLESTGNLRAIQTLPFGHGLKHVIWNPIDNQRFAVISTDKFIDLWDVRAPRATSKIPSAVDNWDASWSPDGSYIATRTYLNQLTVFDTKEAKQITKVNLPYDVSKLFDFLRLWNCSKFILVCYSSYLKLK